MRQELRETAVYNAIIEAVARGYTQLGSIYQKTLIERTKLSAYLSNLMSLDILQRELPVLSGTKERANAQRMMYRVTDSFFRFWYAFVFPNMSELEAGGSAGLWESSVAPALNEFASHAFEDICIQYLEAQNQKGALPFELAKVGRWWGKEAEAAILATDAGEQQYLLAGCKYENSAVTLSDFTALREKWAASGLEGEPAFYMFSKSGFGLVVKTLVSSGKLTAVTAEELA
jgi:hypothetical protein